MEKTARKPVDRQATFDTDPHRVNLAKGNLKLPIIEAHEKDKNKGETKDNNISQAKPEAKNSQKDNNPEGHRGEKTLVKNELNDRDHKVKAPSVKVGDSGNKTNVLSNINKKIANNTDKEAKEIRNSKNSSDKSTENTSKNITTYNKGNGVEKNEKNRVASNEQTLANAAVSKSTTQKVIETKAVEKQQPKGITTKVTQQLNKTVAESESKQKGGAANRSKSPEKQQHSKTAVLKDLNHKRNVSPAKVTNSSPLKEPKLNNENGAVVNQTSKTVASKSPQNDKNLKPSPRKQDTSNRGSTVKQTKEIESPRRKPENKTGPTGSYKETKPTQKNTIPVNNAPAETHLLNSEQNDKSEHKNVKISPRTKPQSEKQVVPNDSGLKQSDAKLVLNKSPKLNQNKPAPEISKQKDVPNVVISNSKNERSNDRPDDVNQNQESVSHKSIDFNVKPDSNDNKAIHSDENAKNSTEKVLTASVQSKNETYVLSPSPTKVDPKSPRNNRVSRPSRLSPSNETVEAIKLERRPSSDRTDMDRRESYAQVFAERNTLLNAEHTYRKRIKQLEDEANGFLKAIDELTTENKYLRDRLDTLEDRTHATGGTETLDRISELEKDKISLQNKIKELEKHSKATNDTDELRELKEQVVKLQSQNQSLHDKNAKLKAENNENSKKLHMLEAEKKSLETSVSGVESEKLDRIQDLSKEHKVLNKQLSEMKTRNQGLEKKVDALEYENKTLSETLALKKTELNEVLGVMKDENKFDNEMKDLKNQILKLNKERKESEMAFNKEKRVLNEKLKETKTSLESKTKDANELKIKLDQVETEHKKMKVEFDPMKKIVKSQEKEIAKLKEEIERLQQELKERREAYSKLENESETASKDLREAKEQLEHFNKELQKIVNDKESQISKLINQMDTMREEREHERKTSKEEKEKLATEMEKVETYQDNISGLETDLKHFVEKLDESKLKEKQLSLQLEDKGFEVSNLEHQLFEMNMKVENYSKRMSELDREKRDIEREKRDWEVKKDKIDDIEASNKRLLEENKRLRNQIEMSSYVSTYRQPDREVNDKPVVEAWVTDKTTQNTNQAIYVQNNSTQREKPRDHRRKKVHLAQPQSIQKKRMPFSKSSPVKAQRQNKYEESKSSHPSTHRSLEDLRKVGDNKTPESEHSLPELKQDARLTMGYAGLMGYREIHKNRIRAAHTGKKIYPIY